MQSFLFLLHGMDLGWNAWTFVAIGSDLFLFATLPSVLLRRRSSPASTVAWLLALSMLPLLGPALWWLIGQNRMERTRLARCRARARLARVCEGAGGMVGCCAPDGSPGISPQRSGNRVQLLVDAGAAYPDFEHGVTGAERSVHAMFYIWQPDEFGTRLRDLLASRAAAGVEVRVLVDAIGSPYANRRFFAPLLDAGGRVSWFQPPRMLRRGFNLNHRNHRKLLLVDGRRAWIGGLNIGDEHLHGWHDLAVRLEGPAVRDLSEVFIDDWHFAAGEVLNLASRATDSGTVTCRVLASGPDDTTHATHDAIFMALTRAQTSIWAITPYFIPGDAIAVALRTAALRGLDVRLLLPSASGTWHDRWTRLAGRTWYPDLLEAGVRIWEYGDGFLHAKAIVVDDELGILGSANLDTRSLRLNFELSGVFHGSELASELKTLFEADLRVALEVELSSLDSEPLHRRLFASALRLGSPLL